MRTGLLTIIIIFSFACATRPLSVRLKNKSQFDFKEITVKLGDTLKTFDNLKSFSTTKSFKVNYAYPFSFTSIILSTGDTVTRWPIDHVGEKKYKRGKITLTYEIIRVQPETRELRLIVRGHRRL